MRVSERMADPQRSERPRATKLVRVLGLGPPRYAVDHALPERGGEARVLGGRRLQALAPGWREELSLTVYMTAASIDAPHAWVRADETGCSLDAKRVAHQGSVRMERSRLHQRQRIPGSKPRSASATQPLRPR